MSSILHRVDTRDTNGSQKRTGEPWQRQTGRININSVLWEITFIIAAIYFATTLFEFTNCRKNVNPFTILEGNRTFRVTHRFKRQYVKHLLPLEKLFSSVENDGNSNSGKQSVTGLRKMTKSKKQSTLSPYRPLKNHQMTDEELFQKVLSMPKFEPKVPTIAFLFLTRGPLPFADLWARFFLGHELRYFIYIHSNPDYKYEKFELPDSFRRRTIPSQNVQWGHPSMVSAEKRLLANALLQKRNTRFVLLSESCIPLFNFDYIYSYIMLSQHSFTLITKDPRENKTWGPHMLPEIPKESWRRGDEWKEIERQPALEIINDKKLFKKFYSHCLPPCNPFLKGYMDQRYIPTLLFLKEPRKIANRSLTWSDWTRHNQWTHPHTYEDNEISLKTLWELRNVTKYTPFGLEGEEMECTINGEGPHPCYLFARKFAPSTLKPLLSFVEVLGIGPISFQRRVNNNTDV